MNSITRATLLILTFAALLPVSAIAQGMQATLVETEELRRMDFRSQVTLVGRTSAVRSGRIVAEVSGRVSRINAKEGNWVSRGTPLVSLNAERLQLSFDARHALAKQARVQNELAQTTLKRAEELYAKNLISESSRDSVHVAAITARERHNQLEAEAELFKLDVSRSVIRAPFDGYTGLQLVNTGEWVDRGDPVFEMIDPNQIKVRVDLPEKYFGHVEIGSEATVTLSADNQHPVIGTVSGVSPQAGAATHTFPVIVTIDNSDGRLGSGMLVRVRLSLKEKFSSLAVSKDAIIRQGMQTMIYTVVEGKAEQISVITSFALGHMIAVKGEGLSEGMPVVVKGNERVFPGGAVRFANDESNPDSNKIEIEQVTD